MVQCDEHVLRKHLLSFPAVIIVISFFLLTSCSFQQNSKESPGNTVHSQKMQPSAENWKLPIAVPDGEFFKAGGWLSNLQLLYIANKEQTSSLYIYNLISGKSQLVYTSKFPIGDIQISPSKKYILIQSSPSSFAAKVTVINVKGEEQYSQLIPSHELAFEWNPYDESEVLISKFQEDWSFQVSLLNIKQKKLKDLSLPQPFLKWVNQKEVVYLNWGNNSQELFASLNILSITSSKDHLLYPKVFQFSAFKNILMTITVKGKEDTKATYTFYNQKRKSIFSFETPQLTRYSDWLVPFYDFNEKNNQFITFRPLKSTSADTYTEGFQLVIYNFDNRKSSVLLKGLENEPISFSPSGTACLYGNRFEKIIDLKSKKIFKLVNE